MQPAVHHFPEASLDFLFELLRTPSVSGHEEPAQRLVAGYLRGLGLEPEADVHGNLWAAVGPSDGPLIGLEGHVDQVGLTVRHITDDGILHCGFAGTSWEVYSRRVTVHTASGPVPGVIGRQPPPYAEEHDKLKKIHEYWIDIGARNGDDARAKVAIGDPVTYDGPPVWLGEDLIMSVGLDDRLGVFCAIEAVRILAEEGYDGPARVAAISCVQEEMGCLGAGPAGYALPLAAVVCVDVWPFVTDVPECDARRFGPLKLGDGPCIVRGTNIAPRVFEELLRAAKDTELPHQVQAWTGPTPTDAQSFFRTREGIPCGLVGAPERYLHTPSEVAHIGDVWHLVRLLAEFAKRVPADADYSRRAAVLS